jgi:hypothetical protein
MRISPNDSRMNGFKKWSDRQRMKDTPDLLAPRIGEPQKLNPAGAGGGVSDDAG